MPWYKVVIVNDESASWSIVGLMRLFILRYKLIGSPKDAVVYRGMNDLGDHIYYFSPPASVIAIAEKVFHTFDATECSQQPDLDGFKEITIR
jgi:hypothetical protein